MHQKMPMMPELKALFLRYCREFSDFDGLDLGEPNQKGYGSDAPMHIAARHGLLEDIDVLVRAGAQINMPGDVGYTPLHYAVMAGQEGAVRKLLKLGANPMQTNDFGETAIEVAKLGGHDDIAVLLRNAD